MAGFFSRLLRNNIADRDNSKIQLDRKSSKTAPLFAIQTLGMPKWAPRNAIELTRSGYERNAVVYRCVRLVAEAAATVPWLVFDGTEEVSDHPLHSLLARPNQSGSAAGFLEAIFTNLLLAGNAYVELVSLERQPRELYSLRPERMSIEPGPSGWIDTFVYTVGARSVRFDVPAEGQSPILHLKLNHPLDDHYGFAPLSAAQEALDVHNAAGNWNKALLENAARPSGALVYGSAEGARMSNEQFERLKDELDENFSGFRNAGRPLLLEGGLDWKSLSLSPKDMDFIQAKAAAAREIALAFGVPPLILGLPGDNTFANYSEANRALWRQTIIPMVRRTQQSVANWLAESYGPMRIEPDLDHIDALADEREAEWRRVGSATFLSDSEKREALGYGTAKMPDEASHNNKLG